MKNIIKEWTLLSNFTARPNSTQQKPCQTRPSLRQPQPPSHWSLPAAAHEVLLTPRGLTVSTASNSPVPTHPDPTPSYGASTVSPSCFPSQRLLLLLTGPEALHLQLSVLPSPSLPQVFMTGRLSLTTSNPHLLGSIPTPF